MESILAFKDLGESSAGEAVRIVVDSSLQPRQTDIELDTSLLTSELQLLIDRDDRLMLVQLDSRACARPGDSVTRCAKDRAVIGNLK